MEKKWSRNWKSSKQPRKQRKYRLNAPLHLRKNFLSAHLSKELRQKYKKRSFPLRKGDVVKVMRGRFKGKTTKVESIDLKKLKVYLEDIAREKQNKVKAPIPFEASNLQIIELNLNDRKRIEALERNLKIKQKIQQKE
jgi:large subunit ribosomal protein L24